MAVAVFSTALGEAWTSPHVVNFGFICPAKSGLIVCKKLIDGWWSPKGSSWTGAGASAGTKAAGFRGLNPEADNALQIDCYTKYIEQIPRQAQWANRLLHNILHSTLGNSLGPPCPARQIC